MSKSSKAKTGKATGKASTASASAGRVNVTDRDGTDPCRAGQGRRTVAQAVAERAARHAQKPD